MNRIRLLQSQSLLARCWAPLLAGASLLAAGEAAATVSVSNVNAVESDAGAMTRPNAAQYWISYEDCVDDTILQFTVTTDAAISVAASASLNCADGSQTATATGAPDQLCYDIASNVASDSTVSVHAYNLVKGTLGIDCRTSVAIPSNESFTWPQPITLYFYVPVAGALSTDSTTWPTSGTEEIALVGPEPPAPISLDSDVQELTLRLPSTPTDPRTVGYYFFCYPNVGGGTYSDAGAGGATGACPAGTTLPEVPSFTSKYVCGSQVPATTTSYGITSVGGAPLQDGTQYIVAVAAYDEVFNLGPSLPSSAARPRPRRARWSSPPAAVGA